MFLILCKYFHKIDVLFGYLPLKGAIMSDYDNLTVTPDNIKDFINFFTHHSGSKIPDEDAISLGFSLIVEIKRKSMPEKERIPYLRQAFKWRVIDEARSLHKLRLKKRKDMDANEGYKLVDESALKNLAEDKGGNEREFLMDIPDPTERSVAQLLINGANAKDIKESLSLTYRQISKIKERLVEHLNC